jgi:hypothetical protein
LELPAGDPIYSFNPFQLTDDQIIEVIDVQHIAHPIESAVAQSI